MEPFYPLRLLWCEECLLVQLDEYVRGEEIFSDYAYFSSYSDSWLNHARDYVEQVVSRFGLSHDDFVVEVASNDGYLLQNFVARGIPCLGIDPATNVAAHANRRGVPTRALYFDEAVARDLVAEGRRANLLIGNNVLAHVGRLNEFVAGLKVLLAPHGVLTMEFAHLMRLVEGNQFDTIYHEHFCYFLLLAACRLFESHGLKVFDVEELSTHGGSLRVFVSHLDDAMHPEQPSVCELVRRERDSGFGRSETYAAFAERVAETKRQLLEFLISAKRSGKRIAGYGAPGKGNTLLNYCGVGADFLDFTVDRNPHKQGKYLPGTHIPIYEPSMIEQAKPDYVLILPWNLKDEIIPQMAHVREWGARFVVPVPELRIYD
jgi:hypothetical protein